MDIPKSNGEFIGTVLDVKTGGSTSRTTVRTDVILSNGDGFCFADDKGEVIGFRGDVCEGSTIISKPVPGLKAGMRLYRNISTDFEKRLRAGQGMREIDVLVDVLIRDNDILADARLH